jgi:hypothetical protein
MATRRCIEEDTHACEKIIPACFATLMGLYINRRSRDLSAVIPSGTQRGGRLFLTTLLERWEATLVILDAA